MNQTGVADRIGALIEEQLGRRIAAGENFFEAGLDSLGLVRLHETIVERLRVDLPATALFTYPNVTALAAFLVSPEVTGAPGPSRHESDRARRSPGTRRDVRARIRRASGTRR